MILYMMFSPTRKNFKKPEWTSLLFMIVVEAMHLYITWFLYEGTLEESLYSLRIIVGAFLLKISCIFKSCEWCTGLFLCANSYKAQHQGQGSPA